MKAIRGAFSTLLQVGIVIVSSVVDAGQVWSQAWEYMYIDMTAYVSKRLLWNGDMFRILLTADWPNGNGGVIGRGI